MQVPTLCFSTDPLLALRRKLQAEDYDASEPHPKLESNNAKFGWMRAGLNVHHDLVGTSMDEAIMLKNLLFMLC